MVIRENTEAALRECFGIYLQEITCGGVIL